MFAKLLAAFAPATDAASVRVGLDRLALSEQARARNAWASRNAAWRKAPAFKPVRPVSPNQPLPIRAR